MMNLRWPFKHLKDVTLFVHPSPESIREAFEAKVGESPWWRTRNDEGKVVKLESMDEYMDQYVRDGKWGFAATAPEKQVHVWFDLTNLTVSTISRVEILAHELAHLFLEKAAERPLATHYQQAEDVAEIVGEIAMLAVLWDHHCFCYMNQTYGAVRVVHLNQQEPV